MGKVIRINLTFFVQYAYSKFKLYTALRTNSPIHFHKIHTSSRLYPGESVQEATTCCKIPNYYLVINGLGLENVRHSDFQFAQMFRKDFCRKQWAINLNFISIIFRYPTNSYTFSYSHIYFRVHVHTAT